MAAVPADGDEPQFRISVCMKRYFADERARCYLLVSPRRRVRWLRRRLRALFPLPPRLALTARGHLLPPDEPLALLRADDLVEVVPRRADPAPGPPPEDEPREPASPPDDEPRESASQPDDEPRESASQPDDEPRESASQPDDEPPEPATSPYDEPRVTAPAPDEFRPVDELDGARREDACRRAIADDADFAAPEPDGLRDGKRRALAALDELLFPPAERWPPAAPRARRRRTRRRRRPPASRDVTDAIEDTEIVAAEPPAEAACGAGAAQCVLRNERPPRARSPRLVRSLSRLVASPDASAGESPSPMTM